MVEIDINYLGDLRCEATHGPSGTKILTDAPADNMGKAEFFSPTDLVATALGTCIITTLAIVARRHGCDLEGAAVQVTKAMTQQGPRQIAELNVNLTIRGHYTDEQRLLLENTSRASPVHKSLADSVSAPVTIEWTD